MFDLGWTELLVVGIVALIVVGPKDLPKMFRTLGQFMAKARAMAREFQRAMDDAADASGVKDVARDLKQATDPQGMGLDELNKLKSWDPLREDTKADGKTKGKRAGRAKPGSDPDGEDEAALDRISAEMEALRRERSGSGANSAGGGVATPATPAAGSGDAQASDPGPDTPASSPTADVSKTKAP